MAEEPGVRLEFIHVRLGRCVRSFEMRAVAEERGVPVECIDLSLGSPTRSIGMLAVGERERLSLVCEPDVRSSRHEWSLACLEVGEGARMSLGRGDHFEGSDMGPSQVLSMADLQWLPLGP